MQRRRFIYLLAIVALLVAALPAAAVASSPAASPLQQGESTDTLLEQAKALAAEQAPASPSPDAAAAMSIPAGGDYPLFMGVDDTTVPAYLMDVTNSATIQAFVGFQVWGSAYDPVNDKVYFNNGSTLYEWPVGGAVATLGTIVDPAGATQAMVGLAFYNGQLYGTKNIANEAIWAIDTTTALATVYIDYTDADLDCGGFSADPNTGTFYCTNDDATPYGAGLVIINPDASVTPVVAYPAGETDIDGLAVSDDGYAYLVIDEPGNIYVYDLVGGAYDTPLTAPWTSSEVFSAGAYIPPAALEPICQSPQLTIPDNNPAGASTTITVPAGGTLSDLDFSTITTHTWVGDLIYTLEHVDTGTTVTLIDRPGYTGTGFGCSSNNIDALINDEGVDGNVETTCFVTPPAIAGDLVGGDPANTSLLAAFDGEDFAGDWTLTVSDNAGGDTGTLNEWCLIPGGGGGGEPPNIDVNPLSMESTQATNQSTQQQLTVANTGGGTLDWVIDEENPPPAPPEASGNPAKLRAPAPVERSAKELTGLLEAAMADVVQDGSFEAGTPNPFWAEASTNFGTPLCDEASCGTGGGTSFPLTGDWWAWFGGIAAFEAGSVSQSVTIPSGGQATLSFWVMNGACSGSASDYLEVNMDGTQLWVTTAADPSCGTLSYRQVTLDVSAYANGAAHTLEFNSEVFGGGNTTNFALDDVSLDAQGSGGEPCSAPADIPWLSLDMTNGSNAGGTDTQVQVTFDSTGLANGVYTGNLCVTSNDPDAGPGNGTDLVVVPVTLTVRPPTAVALTDLAAGVEQMPAPFGGVPVGAVAAAGVSMALAAGYALRRRRR